MYHIYEASGYDVRTQHSRHLRRAQGLSIHPASKRHAELQAPVVVAGLLC